MFKLPVYEQFKMISYYTFFLVIIMLVINYHLKYCYYKFLKNILLKSPVTDYVIIELTVHH